MAKLKIDITDSVKEIQKQIRDTPEYKAIQSANKALKKHREAIEMARDFAADRESMGWDEHDLKLIDALVALADALEGKKGQGGE